MRKIISRKIFATYKICFLPATLRLTSALVRSSSGKAQETINAGTITRGRITLGVFHYLRRHACRSSYPCCS